jgi:hypothetical protein
MPLGPFFKKREVWLPTWRTMVVLFAAMIAAVVCLAKFLPRFLSPVRPVEAQILVVEGWAAESCLRRSLEVYREGNYKLMVVSGGGIESGMNISSYTNYANLGAARLKEYGFPGTNLFAVASPETDMDRTYHGALAVKAFLMTNTTARGVNLVSSGTHARRSGLLFEMALEPEFNVGVISAPNPEFDPDHWWRKSQGVRAIINETVAYLYARLIFDPE